MRVGFGFDVHRLVEGRDLILGGVKIDYQKGLLGVSDADVVLHSINDAILGALAKGDIGDFFPPESAENKDISSLEITQKVISLLANHTIENLDITLILEQPKLKGYKQAIISNLGKIFSLSCDKINLKIKSQENLIPPEKECILCCSIASLL